MTAPAEPKTELDEAFDQGMSDALILVFRGILREHSESVVKAAWDHAWSMREFNRR